MSPPDARPDPDRRRLHDAFWAQLDELLDDTDHDTDESEATE